MAELIKIYPENPDPRKVKKVVEVLKMGGIIIYPTDTVYGLGCDFSNVKAYERVVKLKKMNPKKAQFSFVCSDLTNLSDYTSQLDRPTFKLLKRYLPGPYTFILKGGRSLPKNFKNRKTVGIRVPDHTVCKAIVKELAKPIVSTSLPDSDDFLEYPTDPELIYDRWGSKVDLIIDSGYGLNIASTVVDLSLGLGEFNILRKGKGDF